MADNADPPAETTPPLSAPTPGNRYKDPDDGRQRFLLELEFVQCLANPTYIHYLAQNRYFEDEAFIGYLKYLQYWQRPEYIKFIMYPHCLFFLELLQNANFRNAMAHPGSKPEVISSTFDSLNYLAEIHHVGNFVVSVGIVALAAMKVAEELAHRQQFFFWKNYRNNRLKHIIPRPLPEPPAAPAPVPSPAPAQSVTTASTVATPAPSPMQFVGAPGSTLPKIDMRNTGVDRRKRKA